MYKILKSNLAFTLTWQFWRKRFGLGTAGNKIVHFDGETTQKEQDRVAIIDDMFLMVTPITFCSQAAGVLKDAVSQTMLHIVVAFVITRVCSFVLPARWLLGNTPERVRGSSITITPAPVVAPKSDSDNEDQILPPLQLGLKQETVSSFET